MSTRPSWLSALGLDRRELRAWALYDWANSAFMTTIIAAVFPVYYAQVAARGLDPADATFWFSVATTIALSIVALTAPVLGIVADRTAIKKRLLFVFQCLGLLATAAMYSIHDGQWTRALVLFVLGNIGISGAFTFYDALLPHLVSRDQLDRVSSAGYALGYLGGGLLLAINLVWITFPHAFGMAGVGHATRLSFLSVAVWWGVFSIPLFRHVPEPPVPVTDRPTGASALVWTAFADLMTTLRELIAFRHAFLMLLAFIIYNDGISTIIRMASIYGAELGIGQRDLILAFLLVQFVGIPFSFAFGRLAAWIGAKRAIFLALVVYLGITVLGYYMTRAAHFYLLAGLVGTVQGGSQALSRSLFASMIPRQRSSAFFAFFAVFEKFAGILGPAAFAAVVGATGSSRRGILAVAVFFVVGAAILSRVDVSAGQETARDAEAQV